MKENFRSQHQWTNVSENIKLVQQMLGHASPEITLKYYDKGRDTVVDASDAISKCYKITHVDSGRKTS